MAAGAGASFPRGPTPLVLPLLALVALDLAARAALLVSPAAPLPEVARAASVLAIAAGLAPALMIAERARAEGERRAWNAHALAAVALLGLGFVRYGAGDAVEAAGFVGWVALLALPPVALLLAHRALKVRPDAFQWAGLAGYPVVAIAAAMPLYVSSSFPQPAESYLEGAHAYPGLLAALLVLLLDRLHRSAGAPRRDLVAPARALLAVGVALLLAAAAVGLLRSPLQVVPDVTGTLLASAYAALAAAAALAALAVALRPRAEPSGTLEPSPI